HGLISKTLFLARRSVGPEEEIIKVKWMIRFVLSIFFYGLTEVLYQNIVLIAHIQLSDNNDIFKWSLGVILTKGNIARRNWQGNKKCSIQHLFLSVIIFYSFE
ncbi:hypothetical protein ACJX0J_019292, partial [Zea mays]